MDRRLLYPLCFICLLLTTSFVHAENYRVLSSSNNPPFSMLENGELTGVDITLFERISEITGDNFTFVNLPFARGLLEFEHGRVDIEPAANAAWRKHYKVNGLYTQSYYQAYEVVAFKEGRIFPVEEPADLFGRVVGTVRGYSYPQYDAAFSTDSIVRINNVSQIHLLDQLLKGRLEVAFISYSTLRHFQLKDAAYGNIVYGDVIESNSLSLRVHPKHKDLLPRLNQAIAKLIRSGELEQMYSDYVFPSDSLVVSPL